MPEAAVPKTREVIKYVQIDSRQERPERTDVWQSAPKSEWQYVTIPAEDIHGYSYPPIEINHDKFEGNGTYFVPPILAGEIKRIMNRYDLEQVALMQPKQRARALAQLAGNQGATRVATVAMGASAVQDGVPGLSAPK